MATQLVLNPKSNDSTPKLSTTSSSKIYRTARLKEDLDKKFIEINTRKRAALLEMPFVDLYGFPIDTSHLEVVPKYLVEQYRMGPFTINGKTIYLATPSPNSEGQNSLIASLMDKGFEIKIFLCSELSFINLLDKYNHLIDIRIKDDSISLSDDLLDATLGGIESLNELADTLKNKQVSEKIEIILSAALKNKASDIHFEPEKSEYVLRLRLDGVLHTFAQLKPEERKSIESRIKLLSGLKLNVDNVPQDGRFSFKAGGKDIDVRVSMLPSNYGYSIVMRLLGTGNVNLQLDDLGFVGIARQRVENAISQPQGMILTTGPTGSGKTTTLYTFLSGLNDGESKIITLEDPIEYKLEGISQTQIDNAGGYTFGSGLRSILRQDPDIVMVGEIRDSETAETAVQASMTGHLVLSTLHTNDAAGAIPRLMDMNIRGFLLADSLSVLIAQRLMRRICPHCKRPEPISEEQREEIISILAQIPEQERFRIPDKLEFFTSDGCEQCNGLGYKGRIGAYEVITMTSGLRELISAQFPSIVQVREIAQKEGMITMKQDALLKALAGITDLKEISRTVV